MDSLRPLRVIFAAVALSAVLTGAEPVSDQNVRAALDRISADSMRGHVSFLASDLLEGRGTPSRGQDIAAEYIAAQFRRAGIEPAGDAGYFQTAKFVSVDPDKTGAVVELISGDKTISPSLESLSIQTVNAISLTAASMLKVAADPEAVLKLRTEDVRDHAIAVYVTRGFGPEAEKRFEALRSIRKLKPALILLVGPGSSRQQRNRLLAEDQLTEQVSTIGVREGELVKAIEEAKEGVLEWKLTAKLPATKQTPVILRNVVGLLRGSDPVLKDSYVLVTAHYDHVGMKTSGEGDRIFNGANDDASGTASVMELASAMAGMNPRPKRSVLFVALFGEEMGLFGSEYYGRHPIVPLKETIADVNLEHMGRTDSNDGPKIASASFTGFDFSEVPTIFKQAGEQVGVSVYNDEKRGDAFFARSDNQALADLGIPSHTLCVAFEYPDYHAVGDEWQKIDYDNMAKVTRMVALGLIQIANSAHPPKWNDKEPKARKYSDAWRALQAVPAQ